MTSRSSRFKYVNVTCPVAPVVNADPCRIPRANVTSPRTVAEVSDRHRKHRLCIAVHNSKCGCPLRSHPHEACRLYDGGVVYDGPRPRPQSSETTFDSVNGSRALTTGAARPSDINLYRQTDCTAGQTHMRTRCTCVAMVTSFVANSLLLRKLRIG